MPNWKKVLNPWSEIHRLETVVAVLTDRCDEYQDRMRETESLAFARAADHYWQRNKQIEAQNQMLMRRAIDAANLSPPPVFPEGILAKTMG